jgi:RNA polymerase sigma factor (sigma-70 family)
LSAEDKRSFVAAVASQHGRRLKRFLSQRLQNRADAPDLAQEVYLRLLRVQRHDEIRSPEAYLLTMASHLLREHTVRQAAVPPQVELEDLVAELRTDADDDPAHQAETQQRLRTLEGVLNRLPAKAQAALLLHRRDGYSLEEIGEQLGISRSMAKKYMTKALSLCRQRLLRGEGE